MTDLIRVTDVLAKWNVFHNEEAMERGRIIHLYSAIHASGMMAVVEPELRGYADSLVKWFDTYVEEVIFFEQRFFDSKLGMTGQIDLLFRFKGKKIISLGDYKTGTPTKSWPIQLGAYRYLAEKAGYKIKECGNIQFFASGKQARWIPQPLADGPQAWAIFLSCLNATRYFGVKNGANED